MRCARLVMVMCAAAMVFAAGCSGAPKCADPDAMTPPTLQPGAQLRAHARWLSGASLAVAVIDTQRALDALLSVGFTHPASPAQQRTLAARREALRGELSALSVARLGVDLTRARGVTIGAGLQGVVIVAEGISYAGEDAEAIPGARAFKAFPRHKADAHLMRVELWGASLTDRPVTVFGVGRSGARFALTNTAQSLSARPERLNSLVALLGPRPVALSAGALLELGSAPELLRVALPVREAALIVDDQALSLRVVSRDSAGVGLHSVRSALTRMADTLRAPQTRKITPDTPLGGALLLILTNHHKQHSVPALEQIVQGDTLRAAIPLGALRGRTSTGMLVAAMAISELVTRITAAQRHDGERMMKRLADATVAYIKAERVNAQGLKGSCQLPPLAAPTSAIPQRGVALTPRFDAPGWRELGMAQETAPQHFAYTITPEPLLKQPRVQIEGFADFEPGGSVHHMQLTIVATPGPDGACEVSVGSLRTYNPKQ